MRCPLCKSDRVTEPLAYTSFEHHVRIRDAGRGLLGGPADLLAGPERARVCVDCGHLMLMLGEDSLAKLQAARGQRGG
jgi:hypothetical protein